MNRTKALVVGIVVCVVAVLALVVGHGAGLLVPFVVVAVAAASSQDAERIIGCTPEVSTQLRALCLAKGWAVHDLLGTRAGSPEVRLRYDRGNGDLTSWISSSRHAQYAIGKNWIAVDVELPEPK